MRESLKLGTRTLGVLVLLGALWPWLVPIYSQALASVADALFVAVRAPFGAQATPETIQLRWQPLRYTTFSQLQEQMGYVDRFARQGLQGHQLATVNALYVQAGVILVLALLWACPGLSAAQRLSRTALALGLLLLGQALHLCLSAPVEFQLRLRTWSASEALLVLQDAEWYLYYGLRPLVVIFYYLLPWLIGGGLTYKFWRQAPAYESKVAYEAQRA